MSGPECTATGLRGVHGRPRLSHGSTTINGTGITTGPLANRVGVRYRFHVAKPSRPPDVWRTLGKSLIAVGGVIVVAAAVLGAWNSRQIVVGAFILGAAMAGVGVVVLASRWRP